MYVCVLAIGKDINSSKCLQRRTRAIMGYLYHLLRSAVGMTHVLRSRLVMDYTTSYFPLIVLGYHLDSKRSYGPYGSYGSYGRCLIFPAFEVTWSIWTNHRPCYVSLKSITNKNWLLPSSYLRAYMGCALAVVFQVRSLYVP